MRAQMLRRRLGALALLLFGLFAFATRVQAHGGAANIVHTCVKKSGEVRFIHSEATCGPQETSKYWLAA